MKTAVPFLALLMASSSMAASTISGNVTTTNGAGIGGIEVSA